MVQLVSSARGNVTKSKNIDIKDFLSCLKEAIIREIIGRRSFFTASEQCLCTDSPLNYQIPESNDLYVDNCLNGYPLQPYYIHFGVSLWKWMLSDTCPVFNNQTFNGFDEQPYFQERRVVLKSVQLYVTGIKTLWNHWCQEERIFRFRTIIKKLGRRGVLDLLGMRKTIGTENVFPPPHNKLIESFNAPQNALSQLSVGARALSKHFHRDHTKSWWGNCTGTEKEKNQYAEEVVNRILDHAKWINIHMLAPDMILVIEIRQDDGYGARWTADSKSFRGFLEPMVEGGHETGWRH